MTSFKRVTYAKSSAKDLLVQPDAVERVDTDTSSKRRDDSSTEHDGDDEATSSRDIKKRRGAADDVDSASADAASHKAASSKKAKVLPSIDVQEVQTRSSRRGKSTNKNAQVALPRNNAALSRSHRATSEVNVDNPIDETIVAYNEDAPMTGAPFKRVNQDAADLALEIDHKGSIDVDTSSLADEVCGADSDPAVPSMFVDKGLLKICDYSSMPVLATQFLPVQPYPPDDSDDVSYVMYSSVAESLPAGALKQLLAGLRFTRYKWAMNLARAKLDDTVVTDDRLRDKLSTNLVLGIVLGVVTSCELIAEGITSNLRSPQPVHQISLMPFAFESCREQAYFVRKFDCFLTGPYGPNGVNYRTMVKGSTNPKGTAKTGSPTTSRYKTFKAPMNLPKYTGSASFESSAPIYDGRHDGERPFMFTESDFDRIRSWSLLKDADGDVVDLPEDSLVMLGYTVNKYTSTQGGGGVNLSLNVQFAFALHIPEV